MPLSAVAGIVDKGGGLRIVVTQRWRMRNHLKKGERLYIVPGYKVQEPVSFDEAQGKLIPRVTAYVQAQLALDNVCGECRKCCFTLYINQDDIKKPSHTLCSNCHPFSGCTVYRKRPKVCRSFECHWLLSQKTTAPLPIDIRPDKCGVIMTDDSTDGDPDLVELHADIPEDIRRAPFLSHAQTLEAAGKKLKRITYYYGEQR